MLAQATIPVDGLKAYTARDVLDAVEQRHPAQAWAFFRELRIGTGYGKDAEPRLDAWAIAYWPSHQLKRVAYEVKVSRSDFLTELKKPTKRRFALLLSNEFYFAAPKGLIRIEELPPEAGLVEILSEGRYHCVVEAPWRDIAPANWRFVAAVIRAALAGGGGG